MPHEEIRKRSLSRTAWISLLCAALLLVAGIGSVFAYVIIDGSKDNTKQIVETFVPGKVVIKVAQPANVENGEHTFTFTNEGNVAAYVRYKIVCNWVDKDGNVHWEKPNMKFKDSVLTKVENDKVELVYIASENIVDPYYYYPSPFKPSQESLTITVKDPTMYDPQGQLGGYTDIAPDGYRFSVTILAEGIQAEGENANAIPAVEDVWQIEGARLTVDPSTKKLSITEIANNDNNT